MMVFKGNNIFPAHQLEKVVTFLDDEEVSDETLEESVEQIKMLYLSKGYYYVQVTAGLEINENIVKVSFYIFEGEKVVLRKINFKGISVSTGTMMGILPNQEERAYNENLLGTSKEALVQFYNGNGGSVVSRDYFSQDAPKTTICGSKIQNHRTSDLILKLL